MNTPYVLPLGIAAAAHSALLFGFARPVRSARPPELETGRTPVVFVQREEETPLVADGERKGAAPKVAPDLPPPPRSVEPPPIVPGPQPSMVPPPLTPVSSSDIRRLVDQDQGIARSDGRSPWDGTIVSSDHLDNSPRLRFQAAPIYPFQAKRASLGGTVLVEFVVDEQGGVNDPRVVSSSDRSFEEATLRAVGRWRFEPGRRNGQLVKFRMSVPVIFSLND